jgi:hypothetical protein
MIALLFFLASAPQERPHTDPGEPTFKTQLEPYVQEYAGQVKYCYETQIKSDEALHGRVEIAMVVGEGRMQSATIVLNTTGDAALGECIAKKVGTWRFPQELSGETVYPFVFEPAVQIEAKPGPEPICLPEQQSGLRTPTVDCRPAGQGERAAEGSEN